MSSQIFGNFIAAVILGKISQTAYVVIMTVLTLLAAVLFQVMKKPLPHAEV